MWLKTNVGRTMKMMLTRSWKAEIFKKWLYIPIALVISLISIYPNQALTQKLPEKAKTAKNWNEVSHLSIVINGNMDNRARFYLREDRTAVMIQSLAFKNILVLNVKTGIVNTIDSKQIVFSEGKFSVLVDENTPMTFITNFTQNKSALEFVVGDKKISVVPRQHLVGEASVDEITKHTVAYKQLMNNYEPNREAIEFLSNYDKAVTITIAFGTWCPHCKKLVPTLMKSISECNNSNLDCSYFGINKQFNQPAKFLKENAIKKIPTVIVHRGGLEIGRITGTPRDSMEEDIVAILKGNYSPKEN